MFAFFHSPTSLASPASVFFSSPPFPSPPPSTLSKSPPPLHGLQPSMARMPTPKSNIIFLLLLLLLLLAVTSSCSHSQVRAGAGEADADADAGPRMVPMAPAAGAGFSGVVLNETRRRLGSFQLCAPCTCCGGSRGVCVLSPCCYAINCNIPNRPFGFCSFTPKSCDCLGCNV